MRVLPSDAAARKGLVEFLFGRRGADVAEAELKRMITANPQDIELRFMLASLYEQSGRQAETEAAYRDLIATQGKNAYGIRARDGLAEIYADRGDSVAAKKLITEALAQNPADTEALRLRASQELSAGEAEAAITDLRRLLRGQPNSVSILDVLARAYVSDGEPQLAEETARRAVELDPSNASARVELAQVLLAGGKFEESRTLL